MFKKIVVVTECTLKVGRKIVNWDDIVGIKVFSQKWLRQLSPAFPAIQINLKNGKTIFLTSPFILKLNGTVGKVFIKNQKQEQIDRLTLILKKKALNTKDIANKWIEWRILFPGVVGEPIIALFCLCIGLGFEEISVYSLIVGIVLLPLGWVWERKARKKHGEQWTDHESRIRYKRK